MNRAEDDGVILVLRFPSPMIGLPGSSTLHEMDRLFVSLSHPMEEENAPVILHEAHSSSGCLKMSSLMSWPFVGRGSHRRSQHSSVHLTRYQIFKLVVHEFLDIVFVVAFETREESQRCSVVAMSRTSLPNDRGVIARPHAQLGPMLVQDGRVVARQNPDAFFEVFVLIGIRGLNDGQ